MPTLSKRAASCLHFIFTGCHSSYDKQLLDNINRPSLHIRSLVYRYFYGLAPSYINELLIETIILTICMVNTLLVFPEFI